MAARCYSLECSAAADKLLDVEWRWRDGRIRYVPSCADHIAKVVKFQREAHGITVTVHDLADGPGECAAAWRSHACGLPDDHDDEHVCDPDDCGDSPTVDDLVFHHRTDQACARTGGVKELP